MTVASDYFLEIDGIKGESRDEKHKGQIDIDSFSWGVSQPGLTRGGGGGAGKATFQDIHFTKSVDSSSPVLFLSCASGKHIPKATLYGRKQGKEQLEYYKVQLEDVLVSSDQSASGEPNADGTTQSSEVPVDQFSLNFTKIVFSYTEQSADGSAGRTTSAGWDLSKNTKL